MLSSYGIGTDYAILEIARGRVLIKLLDRNVEATGTIKVRKVKKCITVTAFRVLEQSKNPGREKLGLSKRGDALQIGIPLFHDK